MTRFFAFIFASVFFTVETNEAPCFHAVPAHGLTRLTILDFIATAYTADPAQTDSTPLINAMGTRVRVGQIAVDPTMIPLGSYVWVKYKNRLTRYHATDTGSLIKGNIIDLFLWVPCSKKHAKPTECLKCIEKTNVECKRWGRRKVKVIL